MVRRMSTKDKIKANKNAIILLVIALGFIVVAANYAGYYSEYIGGTNWQIDMQLSRAEINYQLYNTTEVVYNSGFLPEISYQPTYWETDPDGEFYWRPDGGFQNWQAGVKMQVSGFKRITATGQELGWQDSDPLQAWHDVDDDHDGVADRRLYNYYYKFAFSVATVQTPGAVAGLSRTEYGAVETEVTVTLILEKGIFVNDASDAYLMDCTTKVVETQKTEPGYIYVVTPDTRTGNVEGSQIDVQNVRTVEGAEGTQTLADLVFNCGITPGITSTCAVCGASVQNPYTEMFVSKTCWLTVLYEQPLEVGEVPPGDLDHPIAPALPDPLGDFLAALPLIGLLAFILIITIVISAVLVMYYWNKRGSANIYVGR